MREAISRIRRRSKSAAIGAFVGASLGGIVSVRGASVGGALGATVGARLAEARTRFEEQVSRTESESSLTTAVATLQEKTGRKQAPSTK